MYSGYIIAKLNPQISENDEEPKKKDQDTRQMLEERDQQIAWMKKELERKDREITKTKIELKTTLGVLEKASDREVGNKLRMRQSKRIISQKERIIEEQKSIIQKQDILIHKLKDEKQLLSDQKLCKICCSEEILVFPIPCGHLTSCRNCASKIRQCPVCRIHIDKTLSAFLP